MATSRAQSAASANTRLLVSTIIGVVAAVLMLKSSNSELGPLVGWDSAALVYVGWAWLTIKPMNASETKQMAVREDPGRTSTDVILIGASLASLVAVVFLIAQAGGNNSISRGAGVFIGLFSVITSWLVVQTIHTLKYAKLYYDGTEGGIDFNESSPPKYTDFAYLAFTLGMTFQVSDTALKTKEIRSAALKHSLLSYVFGTVIIATTINTIASLGK
jgi:uncharacterized membrane protein